MPILFDVDPLTGVKEYFDYDPIKDEVHISYQQDVTGFLDHMQKLRNDPEYSKKGIKEDWWHYASIPEVVQIHLLNKGFKLDGKDNLKDLMKEINSNYPYLRATDKWHR